MNHNLAIKLAQAQVGQGAPMNVVMREANAIFSQNSDHWRKPFPQVDVVFATFVDYMRESCVQRELDLVQVSEHLTRGWLTLHVHVQAEGEQLTESEEKSLAVLARALSRLGQLHLLTDGLRDDLRAMVETLATSEG